MSDEDVKALQIRVADHEKRLLEVEKRLKLVGAEGTGEEQPVSGFSRLAKRTNIDEEKLRETFDVEGEKLTVVRSSGSGNKERTQSIALLALLGYKYVLGSADVLSQEIRRNVAENGIPLDAYNRHLNEITPSLVRRKGIERSPKTSYRLTTLGETKAREMIKSLSG